jgi:hypothetical protein
MQRTKTTLKDTGFDKMHIDTSKKYTDPEHDMVLEKTISKEYHRVSCISLPKNNQAAANTVILRNYNDGRHGEWNNYCCYDKKGQGSYVQAHSKENKKVEQFLNG